MTINICEDCGDVMARGTASGTCAACAGSAPCEACGRFDNLDGLRLCGVCSVAHDHPSEQHQALAELTAQAQEAARYARAHGTIGHVCEDCGYWAPRVNENGLCPGCVPVTARR